MTRLVSGSNLELSKNCEMCMTAEAIDSGTNYADLRVNRVTDYEVPARTDVRNEATATAVRGATRGASRWIFDGSNVGLFPTVLFGVRLCCLFSMCSRMTDMAPRRMSMMCRFLVVPSLVMLGRRRLTRRRSAPAV